MRNTGKMNVKRKTRSPLQDKSQADAPSLTVTRFGREKWSTRADNLPLGLQRDQWSMSHLPDEDSILAGIAVGYGNWENYYRIF